MLGDVGVVGLAVAAWSFGHYARSGFLRRSRRAARRKRHPGQHRQYDETTLQSTLPTKA